MVARLRPNRVRRTYLGGARIDAFTRFSPVADGSLRPEDWMASTVTAFNGRVEMAGEGLGALEDGRLVRETVGEMPILVKLLDSDERLVIQAHPTVPFARARMNSAVGKTECWYFLPGTAPDACVYLGFKPGITRERWMDAFLRTNVPGGENLLLPWLHRIPVAAGDFVFVEGGVPHAIGGGCFMIETQEPSDLMVVAERFTPSGREIPEAKIHGGLGYEGMFDVYSYEGLTEEAIHKRYVRRFSEIGSCIVGPEMTDKFVLFRVRSGDQPLVLPSKKGVAVITEGEGLFNGLSVSKGDRLVFADEGDLALTGTCTAVVCTAGSSISDKEKEK